MPQLTVRETVIPYTVKKSSRARHIRITVGPGGVVVSAPGFLNQREVISFVEKKGEWILRKFSVLQQVLSANPDRALVDGEELLFQGDSFTLQVSEYQGKNTKVALRNGCFVVHINYAVPVQERREEIRRKLEDLYKRLAREAVTERLDYFGPQLGLKYNAVRIKEQKTRWGSCSGKGNLNFNWKVVMAPSDIIDYVVVHELCHLAHMNHSREFWHLVESQLPDYRERKQWLKQNGVLLNI
ncbi:MAG: M48 family metallopeptidase [Eubacteriales bacterium]